MNFNVYSLTGKQLGHRMIGCRESRQFDWGKNVQNRLTLKHFHNHAIIYMWKRLVFYASPPAKGRTGAYSISP